LAIVCAISQDYRQFLDADFSFEAKSASKSQYPITTADHNAKVTDSF
jgi:hypothetical protein